MSHHHENYTGSPPLRRNTPSLPVMSGPYGPYRSDPVDCRMAYHDPTRKFQTPAEFEIMRPGTPQMDTRPLRFLNATRTRRPSPKPRPVTVGVAAKHGGRTRSSHAIEIEAVSARNRCPPTPKRKSSNGATLRRSCTVDGRKTTSIFLQLDGSSDIPERKKSSVGGRGGMAWLQRPEKKELKAKFDTRKPISLPEITVEGKKANERTYTVPSNLNNDEVTARRASIDIKRAVSSASRFRKAFAMSTDSTNDDDSLENDENKMKKWKKRVFSKDFFKPETKAQRADKIRNSQTLSVAPSVVSIGSERTVITRRSVDSLSSTNSAASQAASTEEWQVDGMGAPVEEDPTEKVFNDSVIGMIDGKVGGMPKPRCGKQWKPPILTLDMQVITSVDRVPVKVAQGYEFWVAVVLQGTVVGEVDLPGSTGNTAGIGLDVGVLLDISCYTSPESFEEMKNEAKRLVEAMETSKDRIAVMTFSSPPLGKRKAGTFSRGRANLRVLNSSGSVAKKQLIDNITSLKPGLNAGPAGRDVNAAVNAAIKTLHNMPLDTSKYGSKRSGHLFLITSRLGKGEIRGDFGGVKVHVLGVGPVFNPTSTTGCGGWCVAMASPLEPVHGLKKITSDGIDIPVDKPPGTTDVKTIINLLRMGVDVGVIEAGDLFLYPGDGCKLKGTVGETKFPMLLPGEHKSLMVKVEVGDLPGWDSDGMDIDEAERQLKATIGQLSSTILTVEAVYHHSHMGSPETTITTKGSVEVLRYVEGVWSRSTQDLDEDMPSFFSEERHQSDKALANAVLVQVLASRHTSSRDARHAVEQLRDVDSPKVLRELGYQVYLEDRFGTLTISEDPAERYSDPMMEAFERQFSLDNMALGDRIHRPGETPREFDTVGPDLLMDGNSWNEGGNMGSIGVESDSEDYDIPTRRAVQQVSRLQNRRQSPDEAKKLWIRLGSGYVEDEVGALRMPDDTIEDLDDRDVYYGTEVGVERRNSVGQETMITLRDVRETAFSPWAL